jgi:hypothetical protein
MCAGFMRQQESCPGDYAASARFKRRSGISCGCDPASEEHGASSTNFEHIR